LAMASRASLGGGRVDHQTRVQRRFTAEGRQDGAGIAAGKSCCMCSEHSWEKARRERPTETYYYKLKVKKVVRYITCKGCRLKVCSNCLQAVKAKMVERKYHDPWLDEVTDFLASGDTRREMEPTLSHCCEHKVKFKALKKEKYAAERPASRQDPSPSDPSPSDPSPSDPSPSDPSPSDPSDPSPSDPPTIDDEQNAAEDAAAIRRALALAIQNQKRRQAPVSKKRKRMKKGKSERHMDKFRRKRGRKQKVTTGFDGVTYIDGIRSYIVPSLRHPDALGLVGGPRHCVIRAVTAKEAELKGIKRSKTMDLLADFDIDIPITYPWGGGKIYKTRIQVSRWVGGSQKNKSEFMDDINELAECHALLSERSCIKAKHAGVDLLMSLAGKLPERPW